MQEEFSLAYIRTLNFEDSKEYLLKYFTLCEDGSSLFLKNNKQVKIKRTILKQVYFNRMNKELYEFYFKQ